MIRHIVFWNYKEGFSGDEASKSGAIIKKLLEDIKDEIEGIVSMKVVTNPLFSSNCDVMLDSLFTSENALRNYQASDAHKKASIFIKTVTTNRKCFDYEE